ncbi:MAG: ISAs1 family transposase [Isosphaeraceae bacterium]
MDGLLLLDGTPGGGFRIRVQRGAGGTPAGLARPRRGRHVAGVKSYEGFVQFGKERAGRSSARSSSPGPAGLCKRRLHARLPTHRRRRLRGRRRRVGRRAGRARGLAAPRPRRQGGPRQPRRAAAPAAHLVAAYAVEAAVLAQLRVDAKTNEHKAALELLGVLLGGRVVTGDAMFTHRDVCAAVAEGGGDYLLTVKENQPTLLADISAAFAEPLPACPPPGRPPGRELRPRGRRGQGARPAGEAR